MKLKNLVIDLDTIAKSGENETVGSALSLVTRNHQPIFIFNKQKKFLGLVSPFEVLFRRRLPYTTKASSALIMPPTFTIDSNLYEMIDFMLTSRIYTIPVFDQDEITIIGQVTLNALLRNLIEDKKFLSDLGEVIQVQKPITIDQNARVNEAYQLLRQKKISRIITVDEQNKIVGIISRSDLEYAFIKPTPKQRFSTRGGNPVNYSFDEQEITRRIDEPVSPYQSAKVSSIQESENITNKITSLIHSTFDEQVVVNSDNEPVGIITYRDVLLAISKLKPQKRVNIVFENPSSNVSQADVREAYTLVDSFGDKTNKRDQLDRIKISFEEPKTTHGNTVLFNTTLKVFFLDGKYYVATTKELEFLEGVKSAIDQIAKQIRRDTAKRRN